MFWNLGLVICLEFGSWDLEFANDLRPETFFAAKVLLIENKCLLLHHFLKIPGLIGDLSERFRTYSPIAQPVRATDC